MDWLPGAVLGALGVIISVATFVRASTWRRADRQTRVAVELVRIPGRADAVEVKVVNSSDVRGVWIASLTVEKLDGAVWIPLSPQMRSADQWAQDGWKVPGWVEAGVTRRPIVTLGIPRQKGALDTEERIRVRLDLGDGSTLVTQAEDIQIVPPSRRQTTVR